MKDRKTDAYLTSAGWVPHSWHECEDHSFPWDYTHPNIPDRVITHKVAMEIQEARDIVEYGGKKSADEAWDEDFRAAFSGAIANGYASYEAVEKAEITANLAREIRVERSKKNKE